jgi:hypothetical protein
MKSIAQGTGGGEGPFTRDSPARFSPPTRVALRGRAAARGRGRGRGRNQEVRRIVSESEYAPESEPDESKLLELAFESEHFLVGNKTPKLTKRHPKIPLSQVNIESPQICSFRHSSRRAHQLTAGVENLARPLSSFTPNRTFLYCHPPPPPLQQR